jgi:hypothetical protein
MCTRTLAEAEKQVKEKFYPPYSGYVVIAGISSEKQMKYEEAVLNKILEETDGKLWSDQYKSEQLEAVAPWNLEFARNTVTGMRTVRSYYVATMLTPYASFEEMSDTQTMWKEAMDKLGATNIFSIMGVECPYGYIVDRGHQIETEVDQFPKRRSLKELLLTIESEMFAWPWFETRGYPGNQFTQIGEPFVSGAPELGPNTNVLYRKIRKILDPNNVMCSQKMVFTDKELEEESKNTRSGLATLRKWKKEYDLPAN